jgi:hypothetical protein
MCFGGSLACRRSGDFGLRTTFRIQSYIGDAYCNIPKSTSG